MDKATLVEIEARDGWGDHDRRNLSKWVGLRALAYTLEGFDYDEDTPRPWADFKIGEGVSVEDCNHYAAIAQREFPEATGL